MKKEVEIAVNIIAIVTLSMFLGLFLGLFQCLTRKELAGYKIISQCKPAGEEGRDRTCSQR